MSPNVLVCLQGERGGTLQLGIERSKIRVLKIWPNNFIGKRFQV